MPVYKVLAVMLITVIVVASTGCSANQSARPALQPDAQKPALAFTAQATPQKTRTPVAPAATAKAFTPSEVSYIEPCKEGCIGKITGVPEPLERPCGMALDKQGNLYISEFTKARVLKLGPDGRLLAAWGTPGKGDGQFRYAGGVAVDSHNEIYVSDVTGGRIQKFDADGHLLSVLGAGSGRGEELGNPGGLAVDMQDNLYVADDKADAILKFDRQGKLLAKWGGQGSGENQFRDPMGIYVDPQGMIYVADYGNGRVVKLDHDGKFIGQWKKCSTADDISKYMAPAGVVADDEGNVYVADNYASRICKFAANGDFIGAYGKLGSAEGEFTGPIHVMLDEQDRLYVSEFGVIERPANATGHRIQALWKP